MITYPVIFFGAGNGPLKEDFDDYPVGEVSGYSQIWQHHRHHWLVPKNPNKYAGITWKDYGVSGAYDDFENYAFGSVDIDDAYNLKGVGNFENNPWSGFSAGFYRDSKGQFTSADQLRGYGYINFDWGTQPPLTAYKADFWSSKFIGKLNLPINGTYQFYVERDNSCRIYVGREDGPSQLVFNQWGTTPPGTLEPGSQFTFTAGDIDILIDFYDDTDIAKLKLYWSKPTTPGGGPTTPPVIITPGDFGNSGYIRIYSPQGPYSSQGQQNINFEGAYRLGVIKFDPAREDAAWHSVDISGSYRLGISYADKEIIKSRNDLTHAGYYVPRNQATDALSSTARNRIVNQGFYAYRAAFTQGVDDVINSIAAKDSFYAYHSVDLYQREYSRNDIKTAGFYDVGRVFVDRSEDRTRSVLNTAGFYTTVLVHHREYEQGMTLADMDGNYFPIYVYSPNDDQAQNNVYPSGYYITGYLNANYQDIGRTTISPVGHNAYWLVTMDAVRESHTGVNQIGIEYGLYFYKNAHTKDVEPAYNTLFQDGFYLPRFENNHTTDISFNSLDPLGIYYSIYANTQPQDFASNEVDPRGYYISGFENSYSFDTTRNDINAVGHYVSGFEQRKWEDYAGNLLAPVGNYFFGIHAQDARRDTASHIVGIFGAYQGIYVYNPYREFASTQVSPQGKYYWKFEPHAEQDQSYDRITFDGEYFIRFFPVEGGKDFARTTIRPSGHYLTGFLYPYGTDVVRNQINADGNYFHRFVSGDAVDSSYSLQSFNGDYFYRFLFTSGSDASRENLDLQGVYYARYLKPNYTEPAFNQVNPFGIYYPKYNAVREADPCFVSIGMYDGLYYNTRPAWLWEDQAKSFISLDGEVLYRYISNQTTEPTFNALGFAEAFYVNRFVPVDLSIMNARNVLIMAGEYVRESWLSSDSTVLEIDFSSEIVSFKETQEYATLSADFSGQFTVAKVSNTLDYWLEIYQRPTYNMGKTQAYFSI
jgi:hypothetical protein